MNQHHIAAIPTTFAGVNFRSRLEARWAAIFMMLGIEWIYEPSDMPGWIPDFAVEGMLFEVKPEETIDGLHRHAARIQRAVDELGNEDHFHAGLLGNRMHAKGIVGATINRFYDLWQDHGELHIAVCGDCARPRLINVISVGGALGWCHGGRHGLCLVDLVPLPLATMWNLAANQVRWEPTPATSGGR